jgi:hypothetical protein
VTENHYNENQRRKRNGLYFLSKGSIKYCFALGFIAFTENIEEQRRELFRVQHLLYHCISIFLI